MAELTKVEHDRLRPLMFSIAYRMVSSVAEAEDIVQEAFLRMHRTHQTAKSPEAFASTVTTRLAIDHLRSARVRREQYVGTWLPEPLVGTSDDLDPATRTEMRDTLSMAFLALLERLTPVERAVYVLREVFAYEYADIATIVEKSEQNCRQIFARARKHIADDVPRFEASADERAKLAERFFAASESGDTAALEQLLADDVAFYGDGGGVAPAITKPSFGTQPVVRLLSGIFRQLAKYGGRLEPTVVNGQPGARMVDAEGRTATVMELTIVDGRVQEIRNILNPGKLGHVGPLVDWTELPGPRSAQ